ncbi:MAG: prolyl aminopeptidase [Deltaproteobacteria bacterium]|nr:prolyl aminopeptidase [Deltaproteobacteria bacterium]
MATEFTKGSACAGGALPEVETNSIGSRIDCHAVSELFAPLEPFDSFRLRVSDLHELHVEQAGNPAGRPVILFHGGPGAGISPLHRRFCDPSFWRVILFDQRGSGRSTPLGETRENTTADLVADTERIRERLGIGKWLVFGGSWGSTLGLAYAEAHPERCSGLILRGIFLSRSAEVDWTFGGGAQRIFPDAWAPFLAVLDESERSDALAAYHRRLNSADAAIQRQAALAWNRWEETASHLVAELGPVPEEEIPAEVALARIEAHYFVNGAFLSSDDQLLRDVTRIRHLPAVIVQGRYDMVCPAVSAWDLHEAWPSSRLHIVPAAGHSADEPGIVSALVDATEEFKALA